MAYHRLPIELLLFSASEVEERRHGRQNVIAEAFRYGRHLDPAEPFVDLSRFTLYAVVWRYDEEPDVEHHDRTVWNQLCADLHSHVASLLP